MSSSSDSESDNDSDNLPAVFNGGYLYICQYCGAVHESLEELGQHLQQEHQESRDWESLDGPPFKVRKIMFYNDQVCLLIASTTSQNISVVASGR